MRSRGNASISFAASRTALRLGKLGPRTGLPKMTYARPSCGKLSSARQQRRKLAMANLKQRRLLQSRELHLPMPGTLLLRTGIGVMIMVCICTFALRNTWHALRSILILRFHPLGTSSWDLRLGRLQVELMQLTYPCR